MEPNIPQNPTNSNQKRLLWIGLGGCLAIFVCLACTAVLGVALYFYVEDPLLLQADTPTPAAVVATRVAVATERSEAAPTAAAETVTPRTLKPTATPENDIVAAPPLPDLNAPPEIDTAPAADRAWGDLARLYTASYPTNDYFETAVRLGKEDVGPRTITAPAYELGAAHSFYNGSQQIDATLLAVTDHAYFWVEDGLELDAEDVQAAAARFETDYYAAIINLFGEVWTPGVDNDPRFTVLHANEGSNDELGRFNSDDEFPRTLYDHSNEQEMVYMNMGTLTLGSDLYFGTLVHELQHLIQWYVDPSEALWVNEGLSQLAEITVGLYTSDTEDYLLAPDTQLNSWDFEDDAVFAHYAGSYLFMTYLWEQLGETAVQEFSRHPANGMAGVHAILQGYLPDTTLTEFVGSWAAANYLDDAAAGETYFYDSLDFRQPRFEVEIDDTPFETMQELVPFGVHYVDMRNRRGKTTISFAGDTNARLITAPPRSGSQMWFAPPVDAMNASLTATFDLTGVDRATLNYAVWYDLESDYDYAYVSVSTDGGGSWEIVEPTSATVGEYGWAYNGRSENLSSAQDGWLKESVSLNPYAGQTVMVRFDVLTDSDITARGFALDDIAVPELGIQTDVEGGIDGWQANGFVQVGWQLPQQWAVLLIEDGPEPKVTHYELPANNQLQKTVELGKGGGVLVIVPTTPFTDETADYWLRIE